MPPPTYSSGRLGDGPLKKGIAFGDIIIMIIITVGAIIIFLAATGLLGPSITQESQLSLVWGLCAHCWCK